MKTIAILGLSGVGKTTLISQFIINNPEFLHVQASSLLRNRLSKVEHDELRLQNKGKILDNQKIIVDEFLKFLKKNKEHDIIFDGHSVINTDKEIIKIPPSIFRDIGVNNIIFVSADPQRIYKQRLIDLKRTRAMQSLEAIGYTQNMAADHAKFIAKEIGVKFAIYDIDQTPEIFSDIKC